MEIYREIIPTIRCKIGNGPRTSDTLEKRGGNLE
jgi:hypothetical protein